MLKNFFKFIIFFVLSFYCCTEETILTIDNLKNIEKIDYQKILADLSIKPKKKEKTPIITKKEEENIPEEVKQNISFYNTPTIEPKVPKSSTINPPKVITTNIRITVEQDSDFIININTDTNIVSLHSIDKNGIYNINNSLPTKGIFSFSAKTNDFNISFKIYDLKGNLVRNQNYSVSVKLKPAQQIIQTNTNVIEKKKTEEEAVKKTDYSVANIILKSINNLPLNDAIRELNNNINSDTLNNEDKERLRYKLIELYIKQKSYSKATDEINKLTVNDYKLYYNAMIDKDKKQQEQAVAKLLKTTESKDKELSKSSIIALQELILDTGIIDNNLLLTIDRFIENNKDDQEFLFKALINKSQIRLSQKDIKGALSILNEIKSGNFSSDKKKKADALIKDINNKYLNYR